MFRTRMNFASGFSASLSFLNIFGSLHPCHFSAYLVHCIPVISQHIWFTASLSFLNIFGSLHPCHFSTYLVHCIPVISQHIWLTASLSFLDVFGRSAIHRTWLQSVLIACCVHNCAQYGVDIFALPNLSLTLAGTLRSVHVWGRVEGSVAVDMRSARGV
jgi:hypothetical protein